MTIALHDTLRLHDFEPDTSSFRDEVLAGLCAHPKRLPCKFFYDAHGSHLFDRICQLEEYYLTRTEMQIMRRHINDMASTIGPDTVLIEYGSGSSIKTRILLDHLQEAAAYVPIDISRDHLLQSAAKLSLHYPRLNILPVCADYTQPFSVPDCDGQRVVYFPGSTIGNFEPADAEAFLRDIATVCGSGGALLIGVDLKKDPAILHAAYNDRDNITAQFNLNLLHRINRELHADIRVDRFAHYAHYSAEHGRIEMHLVSRASQSACIAGKRIHFDEGESIFTESSYKYTLDGFERLAQKAGFGVQSVWTDDRRQFSVQYLIANS